MANDLTRRQLMALAVSAPVAATMPAPKVWPRDYLFMQARRTDISWAKGRITAVYFGGNEAARVAFNEHVRKNTLGCDFSIVPEGV